MAGWRLDSPSFRRALALAPRRWFGRGEVVFHEGDLGDAVHVVTEGRFASRVEADRRRHTIVAIHAPGELFGELALLLPEHRQIATVAALERSETAQLPGEAFLRLLREDTTTVESFLSAVAGQVRQRTLALVEAFHSTAEQRVIRQLHELGAIFAGAPIPLTQGDLASLTGTSRATTNRLLRQEADRGAIRVSRGRIVVVEPVATADRQDDVP